MKFCFLYAKVPTCLLLFYVKTTTNILRNRMNFKDILVRCQAETNLVSRSLGQALCILGWPCVRFCREIRGASGDCTQLVIAMATKGPITQASFQTALSGVNCRQSQKMKDEKFIFSLLLLLSLVLKVAHPFPEFILDAFSFFLWFVVWFMDPPAWWVRVWIELAQSGSLGGGGGGHPPCPTLARLAEWRCVPEAATLGQAHLWSVEGDPRPCHSIVGRGPTPR